MLILQRWAFIEMGLCIILSQFFQGLAHNMMFQMSAKQNPKIIYP